MKDNIFKPLTHMDREGYDQNLTGRFQRRDTNPIDADVLQRMDTDPETPQEGWEPDEQVERGMQQQDMEANGCMCPTDVPEDNVIVTETIVVEFYDDKEK